MKSKHIMHYQCERCGQIHKMYIQECLLEKMPVPFTARCYCGGTSFHCGKDVEMEIPVDIKPNDSYFEIDNSGNQYACGIPHIYNPKDKSHTNKKLIPERCKTIKTGRNAPCPCGSGKKYKRCCGR